MKIQESAENYLEMILILTHKLGQVRSIDVAKELGFSKPSVSIAMKNLRENGYVEVNEVGYLILTDKGSIIANKVYEKHTLVMTLLMHIGVTEEVARIDACKIEHDLSLETVEKLKEFIAKISN
ncbi:MAG: DtxR family transcriptional regulator [Candidatus Epulonipiscioides saccharophilum]|nr:MAG: DtxR family transcriptional regulator [Epulopiscium sp. AS2M-Bin001]